MIKNKYHSIYEKFENHKKTEGFRLKEIYEVFLPFWFCKQKIVVEKDVELDRYSKIILELVNSEIKSHAEICRFLGVQEDDFVTMQFHFLLKNDLLEDKLKNDEVIYNITHEGISFLKNRSRLKNMEAIEFEYFYNDISREYFNPDIPIDENVSENKKKRFSGYQVNQTHRLNSDKKKHIPDKNKPVLSKIKQSDFALFFNNQKRDMTFYDYDDKSIEAHKRSILFLLLEYENDENLYEFEIRQHKNSVQKFDGYVLENKLSKEINKYLKQNNNFLNELRSSD